MSITPNLLLSTPSRSVFYMGQYSMQITPLSGSVFGANQHQDMPKEQKEWGIGGDAKAVTRTIEITMLDTMRFVPEQITVKQGETIRLTVKTLVKSCTS